MLVHFWPIKSRKVLAGVDYFDAFATYVDLVYSDTD